MDLACAADVARSVFKPDHRPGLATRPAKVASGLTFSQASSRGARFAGVLAWKPLVWIGRRSYAIYVLHPVFIVGISALLVDTQPVRALAVGLSILFAGLSYRYYEAPILRLKSRFGAGRETPPAEVSTDTARLVGALREEG